MCVSAQTQNHREGEDDGILMYAELVEIDVYEHAAELGLQKKKPHK